jgi:phosphoribosyl 1,2-cyclic phosphodiesterase/DNA-binding NarL/FixJ family response regulator
MRVRFWGTRGSIPTPGPTTLRYGGNTSCVEIDPGDGSHIVIDCGTGAAALGAALMRAGERPLRGRLLISHAHWDHIQGLPFFAPLFVVGNEWDVYAPHGFLHSVRETLAGQMQHTYFPVDLEQLGATIRFHDLTEGMFTIGDITVSTRYLNHPALTLGYRLERAGVSIAYCCDHEPQSRPPAAGFGALTDREQEHLAFVAGADLLIHDAQYRTSEYAEKIGWGHSTLEYAVAVAEHAEVKSLALTHHDPRRSDDEIDRDVGAAAARLRAQGSALTVFAAAEGQELELRPAQVPARGTRRPGPDAEIVIAPELTMRPVLLGVADAGLRDRLLQPLHADNVRVLMADDAATVIGLAQSESLGLIVLDADLPGGGFETCRALRTGAVPPDVPIIVVATNEPEVLVEGVSDWLIEPFSATYARARMQAALMRTTCRWAQPRLPANENERLAALRALQILDTDPEDRFDRLTRIAAAAFAVPIALVTLIDHDRQWFKAASGGMSGESPRDMSFCAHAILEDQVLIVPDALNDPRFADNPAVTGDSRVRFYAGCPLRLDNGAAVGTLCVADAHPRQFTKTQVQLLKDLARLVVDELGRPRPARL